MGEILTVAFFLGIAGIDPLGALIGIRALAAGASDRIVVVYVATIGVVTVLLGAGLSITLGARIADIDWSFLDAGYGLWATGEFIAGALVLVWVARRLARPPSTEETPTKASRQGIALIGVGVIFGLSAILDPTFVSLVILAGRDGGLIDTVLGHALWITLSQLPAVLVAVAILSGRHTAFVTWFQEWWERISPFLSRTSTVIAILAGVMLILDAGWWLGTGNFLIDV